MARELDIVVTADTAQAEQALGRVDEAVRTVGRSSIDTGKAVEDAEKMVDKNIAALEKKWKEQERAADSAEKSTRKQTAAMGPLEEAVRRYAAPAMIGLAIKQTLAYADSIENLSKQTGIAPGKLQALEFSAKQVGLTIDPVARSISMMSDRLASGDKSAVAAIDRLGLSFKNIRGMNPDAAFLEIAKAIAEVEDPMQRAADATDLFGRTGIELLPLLTSDIEELMKKARALGLVMDDETTKAAADLNNQLENLLSVGKRLLVSFFLPLLPILNPLITAFGFLTAELGKMINTILSPLDQMREFVELLGLMQTRMPQTPKGPGMTFNPGQLPTPGDPMTDGVFGQTYDYWDKLLNEGRQAQLRSQRVLPFVRPELMGENAWNSSAIWQAQWQNRAGRVPGIGPGTFPGWAPGFSGEMEFGLPWAGYAGTVGQNKPNLQPSWLKGPGGRFLGAGLSSMGSFIPGMSGRGSMIGSSFGSAFGSMQGVMTTLGSFAPFLGPIAGIAGGLIGKLFGGGEGGRAKKERNAFIDDFGGMGALRTAAGSAGVSLDGLMNAKRVEDVNREIQKLTDSIGAYEKKLGDANDELVTMRGSLDDVIAKGADLGYNFDTQGTLVSVSFEKMQAVAEKYGLSLDALGPAFQKQRLHASAMEIVNDFDLLSKGGTDVGTILLGMSDKISALVQESIKFGVDIPANMQPYIQSLMDAGKLVDENGDAITDMSQIKFGDTMKTEFEKITDSLNDLVTKIGDLVSKIDEMTRPRTVQVGWAVDPPPDIPTPEYNAMGGIVGYPKYLAGGGFIPRGTDTVPAMLTPGEGVMRREAVSRLMRGDWPQGGGTQVSIGNLVISDQDDERRVGKAVLTAVKRKRRLNAA